MLSIDSLATGTGSTTATGSASATRAFRLGAYYTGNYPSTIVFHEDRLCMANTPAEPQRVDMSNSGQYEIFSPTALLDGTVVDANACSFTLASNEVNAIQWMMSDQNGLILGTSGSEWIMTPASNGAVITPTNINAKQSSQNGSVNVPPLRVGVDTLFVQAGSRRFRQMVYDFYVNGFTGQDLSAWAEHLTQNGFKQVCFQRTPQPLIWLVRNDGYLVSINYDRAQKELGWALHTIAGGTVKSAQVIPAPDNSRDELWVAVNRTVNGTNVTYIERMSKLWEEGDATSYTLSGATYYKFLPTLTSYADCAFHTVFGSPVTTVSGLDALEGETVSVLLDGAAHPDVVVSGGSITLQQAGTDVLVGLDYSGTSRARTMYVEAGGGDGPAQGKLKRIHRVDFGLYDSLGLVTYPFGSGEQVQITEPFRYPNDAMDTPPPLFSGFYPVNWEGTYEHEGYVEFLPQGLLPLNVSSLSIHMETQDG